jgi:hypothetical protein
VKSFVRKNKAIQIEILHSTQILIKRIKKPADAPVLFLYIHIYLTLCTQKQTFTDTLGFISPSNLENKRSILF